MRLSELKTGESATIIKFLGHGGFRRRIMEMGFVHGQRVEVLLNAPLKDPIKYKIMGYEISLRRSEAEMIVVVSDKEIHQQLAQGEQTVLHQHQSSGTSEITSKDDLFAQDAHKIIDDRHKNIAVALVGNPNSGKTSLFNAISGGREHVGNYGGVTVSAKIGHCTYKGYHLQITDLPGTYALSAYTPEERYVRAHIAEELPDVIINTVVASNLERNLYLTTELIDINPRMVVALNMYDELDASGDQLDYETLGSMLGVPMVPIEARNNKGIEELLDTVIAVYENRDERVRHIHINQGPVMEDCLQRLKSAMAENRDELPKIFPPRYYAMRMLEGDAQVEEQIKDCKHYAEWAKIRDVEAKKILDALDEDIETAFANQKYGFISGALKETFTEGKKENLRTTTIIDAFVTHKLWGFPIFLALMWFMFWCTFTIGAIPQGWIAQLSDLLSGLVTTYMPEGALRDMLVDGVIGGVGSVIIFLPNIMILYLFISFMEDSGYLARAAFIMDKVMHHIGVHGKSFIPMIMGFGCNVPSIMACRTIESRSSRLITTLITPFMSCSARIPIFLVFAGAFFPANAGLVMFGLYVFGILMAVLTAKLLRKTLFPVDETPFVMELPPYRLPTWRTTLSHMWDKCAQYLKKMGGLILVASIVVWFLNYYPQTENVEVGSTEHNENSYLGRMGKTLEPVFTPLGLNWKAGIAIVSGLPAKEVVISTLGVLYPSTDDTSAVSTEELSEEEEADRLMHLLPKTGDFTSASALAFLIFTLLYLPCIATIVAIGSEAGWKWACASLVYNTTLAWIVSWIVYRIALLF